jgi:hypothetical protein
MHQWFPANTIIDATLGPLSEIPPRSRRKPSNRPLKDWKKKAEKNSF